MVEDTNTILLSPHEASTAGNRHSSAIKNHPIAHFDAIAGTGEAIDVVLYARVSTRGQADRANFEGQKHRLYEAMRHYPNVRVIGQQLDIASGRSSQLNQRSHLITAIRIAQLSPRRVIIVATDTDRFIRPDNYDYRKGSRNVPPTLAEYQTLATFANGITLATLTPPNTPDSVVRSERIKAGQHIKGNVGGRPKSSKHNRMHWLADGETRQQRNARLKPEAIRLRIEANMSCHAIATTLHISSRTVLAWTQEAFHRHLSERRLLCSSQPFTFNGPQNSDFTENSISAPLIAVSDGISSSAASPIADAKPIVHWAAAVGDLTLATSTEFSLATAIHNTTEPMSCVVGNADHTNESDEEFWKRFFRENNNGYSATNESHCPTTFINECDAQHRSADAGPFEILFN